MDISKGIYKQGRTCYITLQIRLNGARPEPYYSADQKRIESGVYIITFKKPISQCTPDELKELGISSNEPIERSNQRKALRRKI